MLDFACARVKFCKSQKHHAIGLAWETVRVSPRCWKMFNKVPRLGVVLQDSILATED